MARAKMEEPPLLATDLKTLFLSAVGENWQRMAEEAQARIIVQDAQGRTIATLLNGSSSQGMHSAIWNAEGLPAGTYYYSLEVEGQLIVKRAIKLER